MNLVCNPPIMHKEKKNQKRKKSKNQAKKMQNCILSHFSNKDTLVWNWSFATKKIQHGTHFIAVHKSNKVSSALLSTFLYSGLSKVAYKFPQEKSLSSPIPCCLFHMCPLAWSGQQKSVTVQSSSTIPCNLIRLSLLRQSWVIFKQKQFQRLIQLWRKTTTCIPSSSRRNLWVPGKPLMAMA